MRLYLPVDVVDIALLARRGHLGAALSGVQQAELIEHDVDGPEVDGDMMHHQEQDVLLRSAPQQRQPEDRADFQVERTIRLSTDPVLELSLIGAEVVPSHPHPPMRMDELNGLPVAHGISGAKNGISVDERLDGGLQGGHVQLATDPARVGDGVRGAARREVVQEPQ